MNDREAAVEIAWLIRNLLRQKHRAVAAARTFWRKRDELRRPDDASRAVDAVIDAARKIERGCYCNEHVQCHRCLAVLALHDALCHLDIVEDTPGAADAREHERDEEPG